MFAHFRAAAVVFAALTALTGAVYPAVVTGAAQALFPDKADGSLVYVGGVVVGSSLVGQCFDDPAYFWGRLSATGCDGGASGASNFGVAHPGRVLAATERARALRAGGLVGPIPVDLVTASASGIDPHISPAAATAQIARVARARGIDETAVRAVVAAHTHGRALGFLGEPRVDVLATNLALGPP